MFKKLGELANRVLEPFLDVLFYIAFVGVIGSIFVMTWISVILGIKLLVTFVMIILIIAAVVAAITDKTGKDEENGSRK